MSNFNIKVLEDYNGLKKDEVINCFMKNSTEFLFEYAGEFDTDIGSIPKTKAKFISEEELNREKLKKQKILEKTSLIEKIIFKEVNINGKLELEYRFGIQYLFYFYRNVKKIIRINILKKQNIHELAESLFGGNEKKKKLRVGKVYKGRMRLIRNGI